MGKIVHIALWKLLEPPAHINSPADVAAFYEVNTARIKKLLPLPGPLYCHVGEPMLKDRTKGYNYGFYGVFESEESLKEYVDSKPHMDVVINEIRPVINLDFRLAYDFELPEESK